MDEFGLTNIANGGSYLDFLYLDLKVSKLLCTYVFMAARLGVRLPIKTFT